MADLSEMNDFLQKQFTTGQFAAMYGINKRTLMYYDSIDLFKPAVVKANGYRYYTFQQTDVFETIQILRKLRVPLEEIKTQLASYTSQNLLKLLHNQSNMLELEIAELMWLQRVVQNKIGNMKTSLQIDFDKIEIVEANAQALLVSKSLSEMPLEKGIKTMLNFMQECYHTHSYSGYPHGFMMDAEKLQQGNFNHFTNCFYPVDEKTPPSMKQDYKPAGHYLVGYYKGYWPQINQAFQKFVDYADKHKLIFVGHTYVESLLDDTAATENPGYCETRISIQLK